MSNKKPRLSIYSYDFKNWAVIGPEKFTKSISRDLKKFGGNWEPKLGCWLIPKGSQSVKLWMLITRTNIIINEKLKQSDQSLKQVINIKMKQEETPVNLQPGKCAEYFRKCLFVFSCIMIYILFLYISENLSLQLVHELLL